VQATGTSELDRLGGVARLLPFSAPLLLLGAMAAAALPPTNGFASEWLLFTGLLGGLASASRALQIASLASIAALAVAGGLAAMACAKFYGIGFLGVQRGGYAGRKEGLDASFAGFALLAFGVVLLGVVPALALQPLAALASSLSASTAIAVGTLPTVPVWLALLPLGGAAAALVAARGSGIRTAATWSCGSFAGKTSQYTASAFSNPLDRVFSLVVRVARKTDAARDAAALVQRLARRMRVIQGGLLRVYLTYAVAAVVVVLVLAR
ncbi:MAG TPA: hypothetical protein VNG31_04415, partial [Candidatus Baltobacteraceae bacterium]|nr:hypothetical protein [Candidatus Baltobacteraceae bacterium]